MKNSKIVKFFAHIIFLISAIAFMCTILLLNSSSVFDFIAGRSYETTEQFSDRFYSDLKALNENLNFQVDYMKDGQLNRDAKISPNVTVGNVLDNIKYEEVDSLYDEIYIDENSDEKVKINGIELSEYDIDKISTFYNEYDSYMDSSAKLDGNNTNFRFYVEWTDNNGKEYCYNNAAYDKVNELQQKITWKKENAETLVPKVVSQINQNKNRFFQNDIKENSYLSDEQYKMSRCNIAVGVDTKYPVDDEYAKQSYEFKQWGSNYRKILIGSVIGIVISLAVLIVTTGCKRGKEGVILNWFDKWYSEIGFFVTLCAMALPFAIFMNTATVQWMIYRNSTYSEKYRIDVNLIDAIISFGGMLLFVEAALFGFLSLVKRIKAGTLFSNTIIATVFRNIKETFRKTEGKAKIPKYMIGLFAAYLLVNFMWFLITIRPNGGSYGYAKMFICGEVVIQTIALSVILSFFNGYEKVYRGIHKIASGDIDYKIPLDKVSFLNKNLAQEVNHLGDGFGEAVKTSVKNERLKSDLITNVSHDIKTPLTSIINYVGLLKMENIENEKVQSYIRVLEEKSERLKSLTEDLVEASKLSSGVVKLNKTRLNLKELIYQAVGEFEEKFEKKSLSIVCNIPEKEAFIDGDGRRVFRILENLFGNAYKYSLEHTRVYVDLIGNEKSLFLSIKNVSSNPMNFDASELTERFIRGDIARDTEGSGLGLSIVQNLVELHGGRLKISLDGDLFKVMIEFPRIN